MSETTPKLGQLKSSLRYQLEQTGPELQRRSRDRNKPSPPNGLLTVNTSSAQCKPIYASRGRQPDDSNTDVGLDRGYTRLYSRVHAADFNGTTDVGTRGCRQFPLWGLLFLITLNRIDVNSFKMEGTIAAFPFGCFSELIADQLCPVYSQHYD